MSSSAETTDNPPNVTPAMRGYWWCGLICTVLAVCVLPLDRFLADPDNLRELPGDLKRFVHLAETFAHGFGVLLIAAGIWLLAADKRQFIPRIALCAFWPSVGVHLIKTFIGRFRPLRYFDENSHANFPSNITETFLGFLPFDQINVIHARQSFPSGHTATVWGLAIGLAWVFPKGRLLFFSVALLASIQRVTSFAHWPSDVFFGAALAFIMAGALTENWGLGYYLGRFENRNSTELKIAETNEAEQKIAA